MADRTLVRATQQSVASRPGQPSIRMASALAARCGSSLFRITSTKYEDQKGGGDRSILKQLQVHKVPDRDLERIAQQSQHFRRLWAFTQTIEAQATLEEPNETIVKEAAREIRSLLPDIPKSDFVRRRLKKLLGFG